MTNGVGIIGSASGVGSHPAAPVSSAAATGNYTSVAAAPLPLHNPLVTLDRLAGFITEYLSESGSQVISQSPSAVTVAYLRQGLTAQGFPKAPLNSTTT